MTLVIIRTTSHLLSNYSPPPFFQALSFLPILFTYLSPYSLQSSSNTGSIASPASRIQTLRRYETDYMHHLSNLLIFFSFFLSLSIVETRPRIIRVNPARRICTPNTKTNTSTSRQNNILLLPRA
ncbi:hypothetical protein GGR51DRAFT_15791 [Nemania sp. FL0031]|nr:hypothetical protein GGR51DRAFT_15791 [Nemania sp. FL0031]